VSDGIHPAFGGASLLAACFALRDEQSGADLFVGSITRP
jgi:hypothetical protein